MSLSYRHIALAASQSGSVPSGEVDSPKVSFFHTLDWSKINTIVRSSSGKFGVYFLASKADGDTVEVTVAKLPDAPGNELFANRLASHYGLAVPEYKLVPIDLQKIGPRLQELISGPNGRTKTGAESFRNAITSAKTGYIFLMKFISAVSVLDIDKDDEKIAQFQHPQFLKTLGYTLPFDAWIYNGDRFADVHPDTFANLENMVLGKDGDFIPIDNGVNSLSFVEDYKDYPVSGYIDRFEALVDAVSEGRDSVHAIAEGVARSIFDECPKLAWNLTGSGGQKRPMIDFSGPIAEGITAGVNRLREIEASDVCDIYTSIPIDSGNGLPYLGVVLRGLEMAKKKM